MLELSCLLFLVMLGIVTPKDESYYDPVGVDSNTVHGSLHESDFEKHLRNCGNTGTGHNSECVIDGNWSPWQSWSNCQGSCGKTGKRVRVRHCDNPAPVNGGASCIGTHFEEEPCPNVADCTLAQYLQEGESGQLSSKQLRLLHFVQDAHLRNSRLTELFDSPQTDVPDILAVLSSASPLKYVSYEVDMYWEALVCLKYGTGCSEEGKWLEWSAWSECNAFCGSGVSIRIRECKGGAHPSLNCLGSPFETTACNIHPCPPYSVNVYEWSSWSVWYGCQSPKCTGKHFKYRQHCCQERNLLSRSEYGVASQVFGRTVLGGVDRLPMIEVDFSRELPNAKVEMMLSPVSRSENSSPEIWIPNSNLPIKLDFPNNVSPLQRIRRSSEEKFAASNCKPNPLHYVCNGPSFEVEECQTENLGECNGNPFWSSWSEWSCSVVCGIGQSRRFRACLAQNMANPYKWTSCHGPYVDNSACYPRPCNVKAQTTAKFDGVSSSIWYDKIQDASQMFKFYAKLKPSSTEEGTILWRVHPDTQECFSTLSKCSKAIHVYLSKGHVFFKAHYKRCSLELRSDLPLHINGWEEVSVSIENWVGRLRIGSSPVISSSSFSCNVDGATPQPIHPNWDMRTTIGSKDGKYDFFSGALSHLAINFMLWPLATSSHSQNIEITDGDCVKRIAGDENVLVYPDKGSSRVEFSFGFKPVSSEGLVLTMEGDDGVPLFYKIFLQSSHLHLLFQCFHEAFTRSQNYPDCFLEEVASQVIEPGTWYLLSIQADPTMFQLTINTVGTTKLTHQKKFYFRYISLGWSKSSEKEGFLPNQDEGSRGAWTKSMEMFIAEFQLMGTNENHREIELDRLTTFQNSFASLFASSVSESYSELIHIYDEPLVLSCELPSLLYDEQDDVIWIKSDQVIASESGEVDSRILEKRHGGEEDEQVFVSVLNLTPSKSSDSGFYSCILVQQGQSQTQRTFGITIVEHAKPESVADAMTLADSSSYYITIGASATGAIFLLLVVCGSAIFLCRKKKIRPKRLSLSIDVEENLYQSQTEGIPSDSDTVEHRAIIPEQAKDSKQSSNDGTGKTTAINMEFLTDDETSESGIKPETEPTV